MNFNQFLLTGIIWLGSIALSHAQGGISILITDPQHEPMPGAHVQIIQEADTLSWVGVTNADGTVEFEGVANGTYLLRTSYLGFKPFEKYLEVAPGSRRFTIQLNLEAIALHEVTVQGSRSFLSQRGDRIIVDPEPLAGITTSTLEMLEYIPGLMVDPQAGILMGGATPAVIYINGREQRMNPQDIMAILRSLPPNSIQRIEIIRNPSARFDAASSGGIINIVLKRGVNLGRFGSFSAGMNQGVYGNRFGGFSLNQGSERSSWYIHTNYAHNSHEQLINQLRSINQGDLLNQSTVAHNLNNQLFTGFGAGYQINNNWTIAYDGLISGSLPRSTSHAGSYFPGADYMQHTVTTNITENYSKLLNIRQDVGLVRQLDTIGSTWDIRLGYAWNPGIVAQDYRINDLQFPIQAMEGQGENRQKRDFFQAQTDLVWHLAAGTLLEAGLKFDLQDFSSENIHEVLQQGEWITDSARSHLYSYRERNLAAYLEISQDLPWKILLKTGLRLEDNSMHGQLEAPLDTGFVNRQLDVFPYLYISRLLWVAAGYEFRGYLIARRSVARPGYENLTPHHRHVNPWLFETGNPALYPQFTQNIEANISFDDTPIFAIGRSITRDVFTNIIYQDKSNSEQIVSTWDNVGERQETYFRMVGALPPIRRYFFVLGTQYNHNTYQGMYGDSPLDFQQGSWMFFTFHSFRLTENTRIILNGFYMLNGQLNLFETGSFGQLNFSINQNFMNNRLHVTLSGRDILRTMQQNITFNQGPLQLTGDRYNDNRRIGITVRYQFGLRRQEEKQNLLQFDLEND